LNATPPIVELLGEYDALSVKQLLESVIPIERVEQLTEASKFRWTDERPLGVMPPEGNLEDDPSPMKSEEEGDQCDER